MKRSALLRYPAGGGPPAGSVPVNVVILTKNEAVNIERCVASVAWADQVVVLDSGSTDDTVALARAAGTEVVESHWRGFGAQREFALRMDLLRRDWVFFVDVDEWVSSDLATEVAQAICRPDYDGYWLHFRLIFQGTWIRHCGWYPSARIVRLVRRSKARYDRAAFSEHPDVTGKIGRLHNDIVDDDLKGLAAWLHKHVDYAQLEARRRHGEGLPVATRAAHDSLLRSFLKNRVAKRMPARPLVQFLYMYVLRGGFLDGRAGLSFCLYHAWFQIAVSDFSRSIVSSRPPSHRDVAL